MWHKYGWRKLAFIVCEGIMRSLDAAGGNLKRQTRRPTPRKDLFVFSSPWMRPYNKAVYIWDSQGGLTRHKQTVWGCSIGRIVHTMDPHGGKIWLLCNDTIKHKISLLLIFFLLQLYCHGSYCYTLSAGSKTHVQVKHGDKIIQNYCWSLTQIQLFTLIQPNWMESNMNETL